MNNQPLLIIICWDCLGGPEKSFTNGRYTKYGQKNNSSSNIDNFLGQEMKRTLWQWPWDQELWYEHYSFFHQKRGSIEIKKKSGPTGFIQINLYKFKKLKPSKARSYFEEKFEHLFISAGGPCSILIGCTTILQVKSYENYVYMQGSIFYGT